MGEISFSNLHYLDELYQSYKKNSQSVDPVWRSFFEGWELGLTLRSSGGGSPEVRVSRLIDAYRTYGHLSADINPIAAQKPQEAPELALERFGFKKEEMEALFPTCGFLKEKELPLKKIVEALKNTYCRTIGIEYMGLHSPELERWIQSKIEPGFLIPFSVEDKLSILHDLNRAEIFEMFLHTKYVGQKRFSIEGGESLIPMLANLIEAGSEHGISEAVLGMSHRGRLNVLTNIMSKSYAAVFQEFESHYIPDPEEGTGDVAYHRGYIGYLTTRKGKIVNVTLSDNPSHLESVDPVVEGQTRAKQQIKGKDEVIPILVHGDAALSGQGIVYETMQMGKLNGYSTGGTLHIVINNQIGFTTLPKDSRSTRYCTDIALAFGAPVFHVNAEKPEECAYVARLALEIRQKFHCDVFIDLNCYRKYGHNEGDEPAFTQPVQYKLIRSRPSVRTLYRDDLIAQGVLDGQKAQEFENAFKKGLQEALDHAPKEEKGPSLAPRITDAFKTVATAVPVPTLIALVEDFCTIPEGFHIHPKVKKVCEERLQMVHADPLQPTIDWGLGEHLAFASLLTEGIHVRISGQDSRRGTFSHRHGTWVDMETEERYFPLSHLKNRKAPFDLFNSQLSEFANLAFEFGYSVSYPQSLVIWEAQYGDFANGAQVIIDTYVSASEQKWMHRSGITIFLPHGYEGHGPEHSSGRLERFLQLSAENNMQIVNCTSSAQFFHVLRRQALRTPQRPLIVFTPKAMLRAAACNSALHDFATGTFEEFIDDPTPPSRPKRLIFCSGKVFFDLLTSRKRDDVALIRVEQLYPFNTEKCLALISKYKGFQECIWVQEEHKNMGAWTYMHSVLEETLQRPVRYVGRGCAAASATGSHALNDQQRGKFLEEAFS